MPDNLPQASQPLALRGNANVNDELEGAGVAFGELVRTVGESVAAAQVELNKTGADTATALANTLVDVIAVQETTYDDDGTIQEAETHTRKLPLINFIDPPFYEWTKVRVQGHFYASEFASSASQTDVSTTTTLNVGVRGFSIGPFGGVGVSGSSSNTTDVASTTVERLEDRSVGRMRLNSRLQPRRDATVPPPRQVIRGPRLILIEGPIVDDASGDFRTMDVTIQYQKRDGTPIAGKPISFETDGVAWEFKGSNQTDADGLLELTLKRFFLDEEADRSPAEVIVTARIGILSNSISLNF